VGLWESISKPGIKEERDKYDAEREKECPYESTQKSDITR
jgi:hypothetical protein